MGLDKLTLRDIDLNGKRVLTRVDFNVPLTKTGSISDETRITASLPSIKYMMEHRARTVLISHLGRPDGKKAPGMSLRPVSQRLGQLLGKQVSFVDDCISSQAREAAGRMNDGEVLLLENLRFHREEEENDGKFSSSLGELGELYVNDAFGTAHRAHASTVGVTKFMEKNAAGFLMEKEIANLGKLLENPGRPFACVVGGAKVSDKVKLIRNLLGKMDMLFVGGAMMFTFLKAQGKKIGKSFYEEKSLDLALAIIKEAGNAGTELILPVDCIVSESLDRAVNVAAADCSAIPDDTYGVDIGPASREEFSRRLSSAKTIFWNGPLGIFEVPEFSEGTVFVARLLGRLGERGSMTVVGGGDSASAISLAGVQDKITHVSTGGGASLEFLEGRELPGVAALTDRLGSGLHSSHKG